MSLFHRATAKVLPALTALAILFSTGVLVGRSAAGGDYPPDIERIRQRGKLIVALRPDSGEPLCSLDDNGVPKGIEPDIAKALAQSLGVTLEINLDAVTPADALALVREGAVDIAIADLAETAARSMTTPFGIPYFISHAAILSTDASVSDDDGFIDSANALKRLNSENIRIAFQEGSYEGVLAAELFPKAEIVTIPGDWVHVRDALFQGKVDAVMVEDNRATLLLRQNPELTVNFTLFIMKDRNERIGPAFHWRDDHLRRWYDAWRREWRTDPYDVAALIQEFPELFTSVPRDGRKER